MTPKERADILYLKMLKWEDDSQIYLQRKITSITAKQCALIAVDEILKNCYQVMKPFWLEVKQEIEKL